MGYNSRIYKIDVANNFQSSLFFESANACDEFDGFTHVSIVDSVNKLLANCRKTVKAYLIDMKTR